MFIQQLDKSHGSPPRKNNSKKQNVQFHYWTVCYDWYERTFFIHSATKIRNIFSAMIILGKLDNWIFKWDMKRKCSPWTTQICFQNLSNSFELRAVSSQSGYPSKLKKTKSIFTIKRRLTDYKLNKGTWLQNNHLAFQWYAL